MPPPCYFHFRLAPGKAYDAKRPFFADLAAEIRTLYDAGLRNLQIDDPTLAYFCSDDMAESFRAEDVEGSYKKIAQRFFTTLDYDTFFPEYDDGGFEPLRFLPAGKNVILGVVTTKELDDIVADRSALGPRMRVLCAGLPRCATSSLQAALESPRLGFRPCMHMAHVAPHVDRCRLVLAAIDEADTGRRRALLHRIFDGYEATTDFPGFYFIDDLMDMYPDAAVILNRRSDGGRAWWASLQSNILFYSTRRYYLLCLLIRIDRLHYRIHAAMRDKWRARYGCDLGPAIYDAHARFVAREAARRGRRLLVWETKDGWGPLCDFLRTRTATATMMATTTATGSTTAPPCPDQAFPWVNDAATMRMVRRVVVARGLLSWVALLAVLFAAWRAWRAWRCR
ncbi:hypothetical protein E4U42_006328 [Claviceps africana]|uniref:Uncharacterized protein n=1 Tax=Claviceps africana TaxID=83212 RepID=A0A8K0NGV1_9HYPO|nr:hypothetical protein E4U42_006328 [Claviceps africana]